MDENLHSCMKKMYCKNAFILILKHQINKIIFKVCQNLINVLKKSIIVNDNLSTCCPSPNHTRDVNMTFSDVYSKSMSRGKP